MTTQTGTIEAHHVRKVRQLWLDAKRDSATFVRLALDPANIVTLCYRHHLAADRPANLGGLPKAKLSAGPRRRTKAR